jgi:isopenicillin N synthase-like dioxygenase
MSTALPHCAAPIRAAGLHLPMIADAAPVLCCTRLRGQPDDQRAFARELAAACREPGFCYLANHTVDVALCAALLAKARDFFALPARDKAALHIERSPHFRGWSEMRNERDWREQLHFGSETPALASGPAWRQLAGPNLWPETLGAVWRATVLGFMDAIADLGAQMLAALAQGLGLHPDRFAPAVGSSPYRLLKLICYHPQPAPDAALRGVAPHCDWSWITLLLQDDAGGLQVQRPDGAWVEVAPVPGTLVLNVGELVEIVTGGQLRATPHRVVHRSVAAPRIAAPYFVNPALDGMVVRDAWYSFMPAAEDAAHVHRVKSPGFDPPAFGFGASEWQRKGRGVWCWNPRCVGARTVAAADSHSEPSSRV